jgi:hypothetical protein
MSLWWVSSANIHPQVPKCNPLPVQQLATGIRRSFARNEPIAKRADSVLTVSKNAPNFLWLRDRDTACRNERWHVYRKLNEDTGGRRHQCSLSSASAEIEAVYDAAYIDYISSQTGKSRALVAAEYLNLQIRPTTFSKEWKCRSIGFVTSAWALPTVTSNGSNLQSSAE